MKHEHFKRDSVLWQETLEEIHEIAKEKGFWDSMDSIIKKMEGDPYKDVNSSIFTDEEILQVKKAFFSQKIMLIVTELSEAIESDRKSYVADWSKYAEMYAGFLNENKRQEWSFVTAFEGHIKDTFEDEIADAIIRIFDLCQKIGIDIIKHIRYKMEYNKTRDRLHGKEY